MECRDVKRVESSTAELKGVFSLPLPPHDFDSFKTMVKDRFGTGNVIAMYYYDGEEVMGIRSTQDLYNCLLYFKNCAIKYRNWLGFAKIYAVVSSLESTSNELSQKHGQSENTVKLSVVTSELVCRVLQCLSVATLFHTDGADDETLLRFAFRVHVKYGSQVTVVSSNVAFCQPCHRSIQLNKSFQMANINDHVQRHKCCKEQDNLGVYFLAMGAHITKLKDKLVQLQALFSDEQDQAIKTKIEEIMSMPNNMHLTITNLERLLSTKTDSSADNLVLLAEIKSFLRPYGSYQELKQAANPKKFIHTTICMTGIDEAPALLFFTRASNVLAKDHLFYQQTHAFLWEAFNKGRVVNFSEKYNTLTKFQERVQFKFGKSCSYFFRGPGGAGRGKQSSLSLQEYVNNRNFAFLHPNNISKRNPPPTFDSRTYVEELLTAIDLLLDFKVKTVEPQRDDLQVFFVNKSTDGMQLKPALRYAPQLHKIVGLEEPHFLTFQDIQELCNMSEKDLVSHLKSLEFVTEAQEFRVTSLDGKVSFPVGCYFRSCKGGAERVKNYDSTTQEFIETCKTCLLSSSNCVTSCQRCNEDGFVCEDCQRIGYNATDPSFRKCKPCQLDGVQCVRMQELSWVSDSEAAQRSHMTNLQSQAGKVPFPDPPHVLKLLRSGLFNYWTSMGDHLISLKLLGSARGDINEEISKPISRELPRSCLRNKDQMNMTTAVTIFSGELLSVLPDDPLVSTLIPEHDRFWRQNPAESILKYPSAITFSSKYSLLFICDKKKSTVFMANLHNPVCVVPVAGPREGICHPQGVVIRQHQLIVLNSGCTSPLKIIDITPVLNRSRALLQLEVEDNETEQEQTRRSTPTKVKAYDVCLWTAAGEIDPGHLVSLTANASLQAEPIQSELTLYVLGYDTKSILQVSDFTFDTEEHKFRAKLEVFFQYSSDQPLCLLDTDEGLFVGVHDGGIERISCTGTRVEREDILERSPSIISGITYTGENLVFTDAQDHTLNFFDGARVTTSLGGTQGMQDGFTASFNSPSSLASFKETVFVCDINNQAVRVVSSLKSYKELGEKIGPFIDLFNLHEEKTKSARQKPTLNDGITVLKGVADVMKTIQDDACSRTGKRCPQGPDLALTKPTRDAFKMLHDSFRKIRSGLSDKDLNHIAEDLSFAAFTTLDTEHFFAGMRTPSRPTPDMYDYATRRPCCIIESVEKTYQSSFVFYTGPQSHYIQRRIHAKEPTWVRERSQKTVYTATPENDANEHQDKETLRSEAKELRLFAKEFGRGVRQQRARGKTKENAGTLPLALSMMRRKGRQPTSINIIEEFQSLQEENDEAQTVQPHLVVYSKGDVVALKHDCKRYLEPFFLAVLCEDVHCDGGEFVEKTLSLKWLEQTEEDHLIYEVGNPDHQNSPRCVLDKAEITRDGARFALSSAEEQRLKLLANGSRNQDYSDDSGDEEDESSDDEDQTPDSLPENQPVRLEAGFSRSGRRTTRFLF